MVDDGPPKSGAKTNSISGSYPKYAETPMPNGYEEDDETDSDIDIHTSNSNSGFLNTFNVLILSILVILTGIVWTMRTDMNILIAYQKEHAQQYTHMVSLMQNQKQLQWQIVPA